MPPPEVTLTTRQVSDVAGEGRVINEPLDTASTLGAPVKSSSYRDTSIQTLPPPNGDTYKLVYGCDPPAIGHPVMGIAAIGRFTEGLQSNPYEPLHGAAYVTPALTQKTYVDSKFQTGSLDSTRLALMKAKIKASMMASKYRNVSLKAGYVVSPATGNDMIVHSEQCATTVRLDMEGNLLEGSTKGRYLPNIWSTKSLVQTSTQSTVTAPVQPVSKLMPPSRIAALAPSSHNQVSDSPFVFDNEYGSGKTHDDNFVVYDAISSDGVQAPNTTIAFASSCIQRKPDDARDSNQRAKGAEKLTNAPVFDTASASKSSRTKRKLKDMADTDKKSQKAKKPIDTRRNTEAVEAVRTSTSLAVTGGTDCYRLHIGPAVAHDKSSAGLSSRDSSTTKNSVSKSLLIKDSDNTPGCRQEQDRHESSNDEHGTGKARLKGSSALSTSRKHSSSAAVGNSERRTSHHHVEDAPRTLRSQRPTIAPYVPPALRASARRAGSDKKTPKSSPNL